MAALERSEKLLETSCGSPHYASPEIVAVRFYFALSLFTTLTMRVKGTELPRLFVGHLVLRRHSLRASDRTASIRRRKHSQPPRQSQSRQIYHAGRLAGGR
jgi:hypothetical protein